MLKLITLLLFLLSSQYFLAQQDQYDQLKKPKRKCVINIQLNLRSGPGLCWLGRGIISMAKLILIIVLFFLSLNSGSQCYASSPFKQIDYYKSTNQNDSIKILLDSIESKKEFHMDSILSIVEYYVAVGNYFIDQGKYDSSLIYLERAISFSDLSKPNAISKNDSKEAKQYFKLYKKYLNINDTIILSFIENWRRNESKNQWEFNRAVGDFYLEKNLDSATRYYFKSIVCCPIELKMKWRSETLWNLVNRCEDKENYTGVYVFSHLIPSQNWLSPKLYESNAMLKLGLNDDCIKKLNEIDSMIDRGIQYYSMDLYNLAYLFEENNFLSKALFYYEKYSKEGKLDEHELKEVSYLISNVYYKQGFYNRSLEVMLSINDFYHTPKLVKKSKIDLIELKYEIASAFSTIGNFEQSQFYLGEYKKSIDSIQFPKDYWRAINLMGNNYMDFGKYKNAMRTYEYAIDFYKKNVMADAKSMALDLSINFTGISNAYAELGNFNDAIRIDELNRRIIQENFPINSRHYIKCLVGLSTDHFYAGNSDSSLFYLYSIDSLLPFTNSVDPLLLSTIENNRIIFYTDKKDFASALKSMDKSIEFLNQAQGNVITPNVVSRILNKASIFEEIGELDSAIFYCLQGVKLSKEFFEEKHPELNYRVSLLADYYRQAGQYENSYNNFSLVYKNYLEQISQNFAWLGNQEKGLFWEDKIKFFNDLNILACKAYHEINNTTALSYNANLISKSLLLETSRELDNAISESSDEQLKSQFVEMNQLRRVYSKMRSEGSQNKEIMESYKSQADSLDKIIVNKLGEYAASKRKFEITWKDVQSSLTSSDAAIEFARYYDDNDSSYNYMALVVRPDYEYPKLVKLGEENNIRTAAQNKNFSTLYDLVWKDLDTLLSGVQTIYYSPAGELNNVSFSAMCFEAGDSVLATLAQNRGVVIKLDAEKKQSCNSVLLDKYTLHQLTTTRYLADGTLNRTKPMNTSVALYGGISYDDIPSKSSSISTEITNEDYAFQLNINNQNSIVGQERSSSAYGKKMEPLPGTKEEVSNISNLVAKDHWKIQTKSDNQAGEYEFKKELETKAPGVLHFATHGFAFPDEAKKETSMMSMEKESTYKVSEDPMVRCGLMLSGSNISWTGNPQKMIEQTGDDGILTAAEVANLDLSNTKLVVLSACETGLGKIEGSEGTFGLKRGFKLAGVEQMIVSLWSVPDKETMELMTLFYSDLTKTLNPVTSFEKAQKEMRNRYPTEPDKWAGFVLVR